MKQPQTFRKDGGFQDLVTQHLVRQSNFYTSFNPTSTGLKLLNSHCQRLRPKSKVTTKEK